MGRLGTAAQAALRIGGALSPSIGNRDGFKAIVSTLSILGGGKKQMTENERVSMSAGAGTGCMGPGEY